MSFRVYLYVQEISLSVERELTIPGYPTRCCHPLCILHLYG
jgi:hypothetical protein